jgi:xylan 1,4-beta-xylosidase
MQIQNPIIRGFYPDPSVCRANGKYYLVTSSFQFFPGVPLFESEDLVNWKQIGHCLTRHSQYTLHDVRSSGGIFAPTIRFYDGTFYMVTNNNSTNQNFYVTTKDIYGEWSDPVYVDQGGIDPSLFFEDGKTYFMSNGNDENGKAWIFQCEIDPKTGKKLTESVPLWPGNGGRYLESPHLYRFGDWYYLMAAEGGTEYGHMITYARSTSPYGPFTSYEKNPVLTNRNLGGNESQIQGVGHGDLVQDEQGNTFLVCLGFRQEGPWTPFHHLGREVFLTSVTFDQDGWFQAQDKGTIRELMDLPISHEQQKTNYSVSSSSLEKHALRFAYLRDFDTSCCRFTKDSLELLSSPVTLDEAGAPSFVGIRQSEFDTELSVVVSGKAPEAGITFYMDEDHHYDLALLQKEEQKEILLRFCIGDAKAEICRVSLPENAEQITFLVRSDAETYSFFYLDNEKEIFLGKARTKYLSSEVAGGFTGVFLGFYAVDPQGTDEKWASFQQLNWKQA